MSIILFIALLGDITTAQTAVGLRKTPIIHREKRHTYGAAWLSTMARLLRVAEKSGDPAKLVSNLEAGTYQFTGKLPGCGRKKDGLPHARDVLDFVSVHLGALHRLAPKATAAHVASVDGLAAFFEDRAAREAMRRTADDARSHAASLGLVSLCFDCSRAGHRRSAEGKRLELSYARATAASLRATCGAVVAGVMRDVAANETAWARAAGFDGVFVVDHRDRRRPENASRRGFHPPDAMHPVQTWLRFAAAVRDLRARNQSDAAAVRWFREPPRDRVFDFVAWSEQDQALIQRASNAALIAAVDDFCNYTLGAAIPYRGVAYPESPARRNRRVPPGLSPLRPDQTFATGADLLENVSCCLPGKRSKFERSFVAGYASRRASNASAGGLRGADGAGVDVILAADVQIRAAGLPAAVCVPRRRRGAARPGLFDDCAYADDPENATEARYGRGHRGPRKKKKQKQAAATRGAPAPPAAAHLRARADATRGALAPPVAEPRAEPEPRVARPPPRSPLGSLVNRVVDAITA